MQEEERLARGGREREYPGREASFRNEGLRPFLGFKGQN